MSVSARAKLGKAPEQEMGEQDLLAAMICCYLLIMSRGNEHVLDWFQIQIKYSDSLLVLRSGMRYLRSWRHGSLCHSILVVLSSELLKAVTVDAV